MGKFYFPDPNNLQQTARTDANLGVLGYTPGAPDVCEGSEAVECSV